MSPTLLIAFKSTKDILLNSLEIYTLFSFPLPGRLIKTLTRSMSSEVLSNPHLKFIADLFKEQGYTIRLAGGVVRDILQGSKCNDIDLATDALPDQMKKILGNRPEIRMFVTGAGERHGTVSALVEKQTLFEITTLRIDKKTDGRHAEVEFIKDWQLDALRRDFTINSMFMELDGNIIDYFGGKKDLDDGILRFVGNPDDRIQEDYLRILRYFRFYCRFGKADHLPETLASIKKNLSGLSIISGERIWQEIKKTIVHKHADKVFPLMMNELKMGRFMGFNEHLPLDITEFHKTYSNVWSMDMTCDPATIFASLVRNEEELTSIDARLKLSRLEKEIILFILQQRNEGEHLSLKYFQKLLTLTSKSVQDKYHKYILEYLIYRGAKDLHKEMERWKVPSFPLPGNKLAGRIKKASLISKVMNELKSIWADSDFEMTEQELMIQFEKLVQKYSESGILSNRD